jgi:hypothetical protein
MEKGFLKVVALMMDFKVLGFFDFRLNYRFLRF